MKAVVQDRYGPPSDLRLEDVAVPSIAGAEVLVEVRAASVNPPDWCAVHGVPYIVRAAFGLRRPRQRVRGTDLAGVIAATGPEVVGLRAGDEVFGVGRGTFAELAVAAEDHLVTKPANLSFEEAAAVPMSALTALHAVRDGARVGTGQRVLITGAGGGVGSFAVQIAKAFGAEVTGVCGPTKVELVRALGADHVIDYTREDFTELAERYDAVIDNVLDHRLTRLRGVLCPDGTLVPNGGQFHKRWLASTPIMLIEAPVVSLVGRRRVRTVHEAANAADLRVLAELIEAGKVRPIIGRRFALAEVGQAISCWGEGHSGGKLVIDVS
ncbi:MAG: NAD(P)-dependent alcohol dehydrogenase [Acidimicrobiia bacterium]